MASGAYDIIVDTTPNLGNLRPGVYQGRSSIATLRTALAALAPSYYTDARLDSMSRNDLVFAVRTDTQVVPVINSAEPPDGTNGVAYSHQYTVSAGSTPIVWTVSEGTLPTGLTLTTAGLLAGTPSAAATFGFTVKATNSAGTHTQATSVVIA